jgi:DNA invertase Pin-like site-specific DNA recombinase
MAAEIERDLISQRTKEALRFKKEQGLTLVFGDNYFVRSYCLT